VAILCGQAADGPAWDSPAEVGHRWR